MAFKRTMRKFWQQVLLSCLPVFFLSLQCIAQSQRFSPPTRQRIDSPAPEVVRVPKGFCTTSNLPGGGPYPPLLLPEDFGRQKPQFKNYTTENGLPMDVFWSGYKDRMGNLWFGSYTDGVCKFDGNHFEQFTKATGLVG